MPKSAAKVLKHEDQHTHTHMHMLMGQHLNIKRQLSSMLEETKHGLRACNVSSENHANGGAKPT